LWINGVDKKNKDDRMKRFKKEVKNEKKE